MSTMVGMGFVNSCFIFSNSEGPRGVGILLRQELCRHQLDPQQLVAQLHHHMVTNHIFANLAIFQLVHMNFVNLQLVRMTRLYP